MHIMCALIGVYRLQIHDVANDVIFVGDSVAAVHIARHAGDLDRFTAGIALDQRDRFGRQAPLVEQASRPETGLQANRNLCLHVGEFLLDKLVGGQRASELLAIERIFARRVPAEFRRAEGSQAMP